MIDWNTYQTAYQAADQETKDRLHSSLIPECVADGATKHQLDSSQTKILIGLFSEKVLGLLTDEQLTEQLQKAGIPAAASVNSDISQCLDTKKPAVLDTSLESEEATQTPDTPAAQQNSLETEIAETEAAFNAIPKIRTMVQDAQESTTHTSSQAELLDKKHR
jgi:hypothetical protein